MRPKNAGLRAEPRSSEISLALGVARVATGCESNSTSRRRSVGADVTARDDGDKPAVVAEAVAVDVNADTIDYEAKWAPMEVVIALFM